MQEVLSYRAKIAVAKLQAVFKLSELLLTKHTKSWPDKREFESQFLKLD